MENKKTTELIDLLFKLNDNDWDEGGKYDQIMEELETRYPFYNILNKEDDNSLPALKERIEDLESEVKLLKRHKHDTKTGDVLVRI